MLHLVLQLCRQFEDAFAKCVDGGKNGGEVILTVGWHYQAALVLVPVQCLSVLPITPALV